MLPSNSRPGGGASGQHPENGEAGRGVFPTLCVHRKLSGGSALCHLLSGTQLMKQRLNGTLPVIMAKGTKALRGFITVVKYSQFIGQNYSHGLTKT